MHCSNCGAKNPADARYCMECGYALHPGGKQEPGVFCSQCGHKNALDFQFCVECGARLPLPKTQSVSKRSKKKKQGNKTPAAGLSVSASGTPYKLYFYLLVALVAVGGAYLIFSPGQKAVPDSATPKVNILDPTIKDPLMEAQILSIASKFRCGCGSCNELNLDTCGCDFARQEREFIRNALEKGNKPEEVVVLVNQAFGGIKPQYLQEIN